MKKNTRIVIVAAALTAVMAFASCGSSDSSSKADTSSAAASSAAESTAESAAESAAAESTAEESTAAESTAADSSDDIATEIDTAKLTATAWSSSVVIKTDGSTPTIEEFAQEIGQDTEAIISTICFGSDGKCVLIRQDAGAIAGTYTINGKEIVATLDNGSSSKFEMTERDGKTVLGEEETDKSSGIEGTLYGAYDKIVPDEYIASLANGEGAAEGGEGAAEGGEEAAEGGEEAAE